jgi:hypothetical protein
MNGISQQSVAAGFRTPDRDLSIALDRDRPVAFMHVPKTSGTAIMSGLASALAPDVTVGGFDRSCFDSYQNFETVDERIRDQIYDSPESLPRPADLIAGHFAFSTLRQAYPRARYLTVLREPTSRLLSHWLFWRSHTDVELAPWGGWAERVQKSRKPLVSFIGDPKLAGQTDNLTLRMLLWPHPQLPAGRFIDPASDSRLLREAIARLDAFDFVDVVENNTFEDRLQSWIGRSFTHARVNETRPIPLPYRNPLHAEMTSEALGLLRLRSRLDFHLWAKIVASRLPGRNIFELRRQTILNNLERYSALMACPMQDRNLRASEGLHRIIARRAGEVVAASLDRGRVLTRFRIEQRRPEGPCATTNSTTRMNHRTAAAG